MNGWRRAEHVAARRFGRLWAPRTLPGRFWVAGMPRFYFSFTDGERRVPDHEGEVLRDDAAAREHAVEDARYLLQHSITGMTAEAGWRVEVAEEHGRILFMVPFAEVTDAGKPDMPSRGE